jgi:hypothetical protein
MLIILIILKGLIILKDAMDEVIEKTTPFLGACVVYQSFSPSMRLAKGA